MPWFGCYIGIDYSGAKTPEESLKGLRVYAANDAEERVEVRPSSGRKRYWTRRAVADYLIAYLSAAGPTVVGIDQGFSFPLAYFKQHVIRCDWDAFLDDFWEHWPTDDEHVYVDFVRDGLYGKGAARQGSSWWRRLATALSANA